MGVGPLVSSYLFDFETTQILQFTINNYNSCALLMAMTWCIFMLLAIVFFREPDIKGPAIYYANKESRNKNLIATWLCAWNIFLSALFLETTVSSAALVTPVLAWNES